MIEADLSVLEPVESEKESTLALIRGMAALAMKKGYDVKGIDVYCTSNVLGGSGLSSYMYLQNISVEGAVDNQAVGVALSLCDVLLDGRGAFRVHGGGFAGTVQAFVPLDMLDGFKAAVDGAIAEGCCHVLSIRPVGGAVV